MERICQKGHESLEHQGGIGPLIGEMERSLLQDPLCTLHRKTAPKDEKGMFFVLNPEV